MIVIRRVGGPKSFDSTAPVSRQSASAEHVHNNQRDDGAWVNILFVSQNFSSGSWNTSGAERNMSHLARPAEANQNNQVSKHDQSRSADPGVRKIRLHIFPKKPKASNSSSGSSAQLAPTKRDRKRKAPQDGEFIPPRDYSTPDPAESATDGASMISPDIRPRKRRAAGSKKPAISDKEHHIVQHDKPEPYGQPPVWADKRQTLCETLPYYRAFQSGAHISQGVTRAFMVDKEVGIRDKLDDEILIARV